MQSSMAVAGMDALSYPCENILTRRANQWHYSIIVQFAKRPWPCPTTGSCSAIAGKKSLPTIEVASARRSSMGSPKLHGLAEVASARHSEGSPLALPHSSRPRQGNGTSTWKHKSVLQPILRDGHGACHRARIRATRWRPPQDGVGDISAAVATIKSLARELILGPTALRIDAVLAAVKAWPGGS